MLLFLSCNDGIKNQVLIVYYFIMANFAITVLEQSDEYHEYFIT